MHIFIATLYRFIIHIATYIYIIHSLETFSDVNIRDIYLLSTSIGTKFSKVYQHPITFLIFIFSSV